MFFNVSNHPSSKWSPEQLAVSQAFGGAVVDVQFPNVPPTATTEEVFQMARAVWHQMLQQATDSGLLCSVVCTAMVQGESSLAFELSRILLTFGWRVVVATSERNVEEVDGKKVVTFKFVQFRELRS